MDVMYYPENKKKEINGICSAPLQSTADTLGCKTYVVEFRIPDYFLTTFAFENYPSGHFSTGAPGSIQNTVTLTHLFSAKRNRYGWLCAELNLSIIPRGELIPGFRLLK